MNIVNIQHWAEYGWICPKCGRVMSPKTSECIYCNCSNIITVNAAPYATPYTNKAISKETGNE